MTPVDQEFLHLPEIGQYGDCQRAVIASLLDLKIEDVPHFGRVNDPVFFWAELGKYVESQGYRFIEVESDAMKSFGGETFHQIVGPSPRGNGVYHAVVGMNGKIVHDPHPSRAGLAGDPVDWTYCFLVKL